MEQKQNGWKHRNRRERDETTDTTINFTVHQHKNEGKKDNETPRELLKKEIEQTREKPYQEQENRKEGRIQNLNEKWQKSELSAKALNKIRW